MLPPSTMAFIKNQATAQGRPGPWCGRGVLVWALLAALVLAGCSPPGPRALLDGKRLIEEGRYEQAVAKLQIATFILTTNAQAWDYLCLGCQDAGRNSEAETAYRRALTFNHDLMEARFNLGCLLLAQNRFDDAKTE